MTDDTMAMTRRRLLGAVTAVGFASAGAGAGTVAMVSDSETESGTVSAGTIDLTLNSENATVQFLSEAEIQPGASGTASVAIANVGSLDARIVVEVADLTDYENGIVGNENTQDDTPNTGELQDELEVDAQFQNGPDLWSGGYDTVAAKLSTGTEYDPGYQVAAGGSATFELPWRLPDSDLRDVQSDSIELTLQFSLEQPGGG